MWWLLRKRRDQGGAEVTGNPRYTLPNPPGRNAAQETIVPREYYRYHAGDLITPGAASWVLDMPHDTPLYTLWGAGTLRNPGAWPLPGRQTLDARLAVPGFAPAGTPAGNLPPETLVPSSQMYG